MSGNQAPKIKAKLEGGEVGPHVAAHRKTFGDKAGGGGGTGTLADAPIDNELDLRA